MKYFSPLVLMLCICRMVLGQTVVGGNITTNTTWDVTGSPYIVQSNVEVDSNIVLTIDPDVTVKFSKNKTIIVNGTIRSIGESDKPVIFSPDTTGDPEDFFWAGIYLSESAEPFNFLDQEGCFFKYCEFSYAGSLNFTVDPSGNTAFTVYSQVSLGFDHCAVLYSACGLVGASSSQVSHNFFKGCTADLYSGSLVKAGQNSVIFNNLMYDNAVATGAGMVSVNKNVAVYNNLIIDNDFIFYTAFNFAYLGTFFGNTLVDNTDLILSVAGSLIYENTIVRNDAGLQTILLANCDPSIYNNNILRNESDVSGVELELAATFGIGFTAIAENNYWGSPDSTGVAEVIKDFSDDGNLCTIDFIPFLATPDTNAPILVPTGVMKGINWVNGNTIVYWNKNIDTDTKGYRVYFYDYTGYSFSSVVDALLDTFVEFSTPVTEAIAVTAYDKQFDGSNDQYEGHESWFTLAIEDHTVSDHNISLNESMSVYPNPSDGEVHIRLMASSIPADLNIFDASGRKIQTYQEVSPDFNIQLDHAGVYFLQLSVADHPSAFQKLIVLPSSSF